MTPEPSATIPAERACRDRFVGAVRHPTVQKGSSQMNSLTTGPVAQVLERLHREAEAADHELVAAMMAVLEMPGAAMDTIVATVLAKEKDYRANSREHVERFLAVSPTYGRFLYMAARACHASRIVEFGTSMGISTIYLAAALRDNGGGYLVSGELQSDKVVRARANLGAAGLENLVDIREGDALETFKNIEGHIDLLLLDGAMTLYLPVLKLIERHLKSGAVVLAENAFEPGYLDYIRNPANGYVSLPLPDPERGNEFGIRLSSSDEHVTPQP
jgi:predicted O-methyltransferase YrrM